MASRHGIGLRTPHVAQLLEGALPVGLFEAITENHLGRGGRAAGVLERIRKDADLVFHGVSMSLGGGDEFPAEYLNGLEALVQRFQPLWVGDHLCFSGAHGLSGHDLWPVPFTEATVEHFVRRIGQVQDRLGRRLVLENVSSYLELHESELTEAEFVREVAERADCELLLDLNNVWVNAKNHGFDPYAYVRSLPSKRIRQLHLAGHQDMGTHLFDTHDGPVCDDVWKLYEACVEAHGPIATIIEWDEQLPLLERVVEEARRAQALEKRVLEGRAA